MRGDYDPPGGAFRPKGSSAMTRRATGIARGLIGCVLVSTAISGAAAGPLPPASSNVAAHVYVFTGFLGFQTRLQGAIDKVERHNVPVTVSQSYSWSSVAASAIDDYRNGTVRSVVIVGYSVGGGAAAKMAAKLDEAQVPVELIVTVEPMDVTEIRGNVRRAINYYLPNGWGSALQATKDFHGSLRNIADQDPTLDHFSLVAIHEDDVVAQVLSAIAPPPSASSAQRKM
jgi:hypothetical protein